ncbi:hypothetical protein WDW37_08920 [Bdellovibrionota bacterium FG-1]
MSNAQGLSYPVARTLDEPPRILGLSPTELAASALFYAILSPVLRGVPYSALLSLVLSAGLTVTLLILGRTYPPNHGLFWGLRMVRPGVTWVSPIQEEVYRNAR